MTGSYRPAWLDADGPGLVRHIAEGSDHNLSWMGETCWKNPLDLMIYQEIVFEVRPTLVIETGTHAGGSALFWRDMMRLARTDGRVVSVDVDPGPRSIGSGDGVTFLVGSSTEPKILGAISGLMQRHDRVLVNLDSNHAYNHVLGELRAYAPWVSVGSYIIVEDGVDDWLLDRRGPFHASRDWLLSAGSSNFVPDWDREKLGITNCPAGFLRRVE